MEKNSAFIYVMISITIIIVITGIFISLIFPTPDIDVLSSVPEKKAYKWENLDLGTNPGANITIIVFGDFKCPYCADASLSINRLLELYPNKISFVYKHFTENSKDSARAALASECARLQNKFLEYHNILYERQLDFSYQKLIEFASELGLDAADFKGCMENFTPIAKIENDLKEAKLNEVRGTPTLFINNRKIEGAQPLSAIKLLVEQELTRVKE